MHFQIMIPALVSCVAAMGQYVFIDKKAPDLSLNVVWRPASTAKSKLPEQIKIDSLQGKPLVLMFVVSDCSHCKKFSPKVASLWKQVGIDNVNLFVVRSSTADTNAKVIELLKERGLRAPLVDDSSGDLARAFRVRIAPTFIVIDEDGTVRYSGGYDDGMDHANQKPTYVFPTVIRNVMANLPVTVKKTLPMGCAITVAVKGAKAE